MIVWLHLNPQIIVPRQNIPCRSKDFSCNWSMKTLQPVEKAGGKPPWVGAFRTFKVPNLFVKAPILLPPISCLYRFLAMQAVMFERFLTKTKCRWATCGSGSGCRALFALALCCAPFLLAFRHRLFIIRARWLFPAVRNCTPVALPMPQARP